VSREIAYCYIFMKDLFANEVVIYLHMLGSRVIDWIGG